MLKFTVIFSLLIVVVYSRIRPCNTPGGPNDPSPVSVDIIGCPNDSPTRCKMIRGQNFLGVFGFRSTHDTDTLRPQIIGNGLGIRYEYQLPEDRRIGCNWLAPGTVCPLSVGETARYNLSMPVIDEYPLVQVDIEMRLFNSINALQFCSLIEAEIVSS